MELARFKSEFHRRPDNPVVSLTLAIDSRIIDRSVSENSSEQKPLPSQNDSDEHESKGRKPRNAQQAINARNFYASGN